MTETKQIRYEDLKVGDIIRGSNWWNGKNKLRGENNATLCVFRYTWTYGFI